MSKKPLVKEKDRFVDDSPAYRRKRRAGYAGLFWSNIGFLLKMATGRAPKPTLFKPHDLDPGFFGANCPPSPTVELEDLMFECLSELGLRSVRVDWGYESDPGIVSRWLERLLAAGIEPLVHLVQPSSEASRMDESGARERWGDFLESVFERFAPRIRRYEIGSTPNRHSWSGYTVGDYVTACRLAQDRAEARGLELLGPNISDFAPYYTIAVLSACRRRKVRFAAMTDNLFVDRGGAPESYDPSVLGRRMRDVARGDLPGKSMGLLWVARAYGIEEVCSTYSYYTLNVGATQRKSDRRPLRYVSLQTYADYLTRYFILSAAAGMLRRVYWGNLAGYYKGVLDDGYRHRPDPPTVHHKFLNYGEADDYRRRPAFEAFRTVVAQLSGARFVVAPSGRDPYVFEFERDGRSIVAAWSAKPAGDGSAWVDALLADGATVLSRDGEEQRLEPPVHLGPSPIYLVR
jgi:hypothetical protein